MFAAVQHDVELGMHCWQLFGLYVNLPALLASIHDISMTCQPFPWGQLCRPWERRCFARWFLARLDASYQAHTGLACSLQGFIEQTATVLRAVVMLEASGALVGALQYLSGVICQQLKAQAAACAAPGKTIVYGYAACAPSYTNCAYRTHR